jgi:hypothetical protein
VQRGYERARLIAQAIEAAWVVATVLFQPLLDLGPTQRARRRAAPRCERNRKPGRLIARACAEVTNTEPSSAGLNVNAVRPVMTAPGK